MSYVRGLLYVMDSPWTNRDLYVTRLAQKEAIAAGRIAQVAYEYAVQYRYGYHHAWALCADHLARVVQARQPLILAHAIARHRQVPGVRTLLQALGADVTVVDRIVATGRRARRVERRPVRSVPWVTQTAG